MSDAPKPEPKPAAPRLSAQGQARADDRFARQAAALRANLARRKAQLRARTDHAGDPTDPDPAAAQAVIDPNQGT